MKGGAVGRRDQAQHRWRMRRRNRLNEGRRHWACIAIMLVIVASAPPTWAPRWKTALTRTAIPGRTMTKSTTTL